MESLFTLTVREPQTVLPDGFSPQQTCLPCLRRRRETRSEPVKRAKCSGLASTFLTEGAIVAVGNHPLEWHPGRDNPQPCSPRACPRSRFGDLRSHAMRCQDFKDLCLIIVGPGGPADATLAKRRLQAGGRLAHITSLARASAEFSTCV